MHTHAQLQNFGSGCFGFSSAYTIHNHPEMREWTKIGFRWDLIPLQIMTCMELLFQYTFMKNSFHGNRTLFISATGKMDDHMNAY